MLVVVQIPSKKSRNYPRFTVTHKCCSTKNKPKIRWLLSWLGKVPRKALDIQIFPLPNFTTKLLFSMGNHGMRRSSFFLLLFYSLSRIEGGFLKKHYVWKSFKMSHSTLRAKRATFIFWVDKSSLKVYFWHFPSIFDLLKLTCLVTLFGRNL